MHNTKDDIRQEHILMARFTLIKQENFPLQSSRGHKYVIICYKYDSSTILSISIPIKNWSATELYKAYQQVCTMLIKAGFQPILHKLENKTSSELEAFIDLQNTQLQCVPPDIHRTNAVKWVIQTWKNHIKAGLTSLPQTFPLSHEYCLTKQADITLNLFSPCLKNTN